MHAHAELGVAAHWRYKESGASTEARGEYEDKIAWLRQLLSWRDEIADSVDSINAIDWVEQFKRAALDDTVYVLTPQDKVIDLPRGATPLDFAFRLHTDLGYRCRGARVDGHLAPLNTVLQNGQRVEILSAKSGSPSRDWLNPAQGYLVSTRARHKVKQWFALQDEVEMLAQGRAIVQRELQREGQTQVNLDELAARLGLKSADALFLAAARGEIGPRAIDRVVRSGNGGGNGGGESAPDLTTHKSRVAQGRILIVGVDKLLTQIGACCKPMPPDAITGFVTRGRGVSVHRVDCSNYRNMANRNPERVISAEWGPEWGGDWREGADKARPPILYSTDLWLEAIDRQGLLRDISDVLSREKINVTATKTHSHQGVARMSVTIEVSGTQVLHRTLTLLREVSGVTLAQRR